MWYNVFVKYYEIISHQLICVDIFTCFSAEYHLLHIRLHAVVQLDSALKSDYYYNSSGVSCIMNAGVCLVNAGRAYDTA